MQGEKSTDSNKLDEKDPNRFEPEIRKLFQGKPDDEIENLPVVGQN